MEAGFLVTFMIHGSTLCFVPHSNLFLPFHFDCYPFRLVPILPLQLLHIPPCSNPSTSTLAWTLGSTCPCAPPLDLPLPWPILPIKIIRSLLPHLCLICCLFCDSWQRQTPGGRLFRAWLQIRCLLPSSSNRNRTTSCWNSCSSGTVMWGRKSFFRAWKTGHPNRPTTTTQQVHWSIDPFKITPVTHDTYIHGIYMIWYRLQTSGRPTKGLLWYLD